MKMLEIVVLLGVSVLPRAITAEECPVNINPLDLYYSYIDCLLEIESGRLEQHIIEEKEIASHFTEKSGSAFTGARFLGNTIKGVQMGLPAKLSTKCLEYVKEQYDLSKCQVETALPQLQQEAATHNNIGWQWDWTDVSFLDQEEASCLFQPSRDFGTFCSGDAYNFRTIDGTCNNLMNREWGSSMRPFARFIDPDYADGIGLPRQAKDGTPLPSARLVSIAIHTHPVDKVFDDFLTVMHMTFGQVVDHDTDRTAISKLMTGMGSLVDVQCGDDGCNTTGVENENCYPIPVASDDPDFNQECLQFVRSQGVMRDDCKPGPKEQLNQITSFLDLSMVYGSTEAEHAGVRDTSDPSRGRLQLIPNRVHGEFKPMLPPGVTKDCVGMDANVNCFTAGDSRVNEQVGLMTLHTLLQRAHNDIEEKLHALNPHWGGERLFHETRHIFAAMHQEIVYKEYLPPLLGLDALQKYGLKLNNGYYYGYDGYLNPDITTTFATSAFRFGHSQIQEMFRFTDKSFATEAEKEFSEVLNRPKDLFAPDFDPSLPGTDCIALGMATQRGQLADRFFARSMQRNLFSLDPPHKAGTDLAALDVQRARDHGIPGYNAWREYCGLHVAADFDDLIDIPEDTRDEFRNLYTHINDVELFPAAMAETHVPLGVVGPTFACILGEEFSKLRRGDRFWFERPTYFGVRDAADKLEEIRKYTFARLLCDNGDHIETIQKYIMLIPLQDAANSPTISTLDNYYKLASLYYGDNNERRPCSEIPSINFDLWKE